MIARVLALCLVMLSGCKRSGEQAAPESLADSTPKPPQFAIAALWVADATEGSARPLSLSEEAGPWVKEVLSGPGSPVPWAPDRPASEGGVVVRAAVYYSLVDGDRVLTEVAPGTAYATVELFAERKLGAEGKERWTAEGRAEVAFAPGNGELAAVFADVVKRAASAAAANLARELGLGSHSDDALRSELAGADKDARFRALRQVAEQRRVSLVQPVIALLGSTDPDEVRAAVTALGALGSGDAVGPLAALTNRNDPELLFLVVAALRRIPGDEARQYLQGIAETHAYDSVRAEAEKALRAPP
jgi:hypothetical protein